MDWQQPAIRNLIQLALNEDCVRTDVTTYLALPVGRQAQAEIVAREELLACGLPIAEAVFFELDWPVSCEYLCSEGQRVKAQDVLLRLSADVRHLISAERVILNFLQRLCGVATFTRSYVEKAQGVALYDTRKTTPGWRILEKYAVQVGGAHNQRAHLADAILVKNNHLDAILGGKPWSVEDLRKALERIVKANVQGLSLQVEVRDQLELQAVLDTSIDRVMLDNMSDQQISECMQLIGSKKPALFVEVSGNVDAQRIESLAKLGVQAASLGAFTRKAESLDISMRVLI